MFTLTIRDKPVAGTDADEDEARELFLSGAFKRDLLRLSAKALRFGTAARRSRPGPHLSWRSIRSTK